MSQLIQLTTADVSDAEELLARYEAKIISGGEDEELGFKAVVEFKNEAEADRFADDLTQKTGEPFDFVYLSRFDIPEDVATAMRNKARVKVLRTQLEAEEKADGVNPYRHGSVVWHQFEARKRGHKVPRLPPDPNADK